MGWWAGGGGSNDINFMLTSTRVEVGVDYGKIQVFEKKSVVNFGIQRCFSRRRI